MFNYFNFIIITICRKKKYYITTVLLTIIQLLMVILYNKLACGKFSHLMDYQLINNLQIDIFDVRNAKKNFECLNA